MKPKAKIFHFLGYDFKQNNLEIIFKYRIEFSNKEPLDFTETIVLPEIPRKFSKKFLKETLPKILDPLHLILGISYYKIYCPPKVKLPFKLSLEQANFWNIVYRKGLGEFLYKNKLNPKILAKFPYSQIKSHPSNIKVKNRILLGIGGGKESIVAAELLKKFDFTSFLVETHKRNRLSENVIRKIGNPKLNIFRRLDEKIFQKHENSHSGHIPISAIYAFLGLLGAALYNYKYVIVGNEHSSNFGNILYKGELVNHQWSKSTEFEVMMQKYTKKFITPDIVYFSLLRPFYEIRIAEMFSKHKKYFSVFASCNGNFKIEKINSHPLWCNHCPKCLFTFLMLSPFLKETKLTGIFKKNLFSDEKLIPFFNDLLGFGKLKPFDCVGTFEESRVAMLLSSKYYENEIVIKKLLPKIKTNSSYVTICEKVFQTAITTKIPAPFTNLL